MLVSAVPPTFLLGEQMEKWSSDAYNHFKMPPEIFYEDGEVKYRYWCLRYVL